MLSGISKHLFGAYPALLFLVILAGHQSCSARKSSAVYCAPSSCGNIHSISYPFRLRTDPNSCGNKKYELTCENNRPALYLKRVKYYVQAIHYNNLTIRLVDADVQKDDCLSIPRHPLILDPSDNKDYLPYNLGWSAYNNISLDTSTFVFISCSNPILSPSHYIVDASSCKNGSTLLNSMSNISSPSSHNIEGYSYVFIGSSSGDIPDLCHVNLMYAAPFTFDLPKNETNIISYIDVHESILYGFDLSWSGACCDFLKENHCELDEATINKYCNKDFSGALIRIAIDVWPLNRYLLDGEWIIYQSGNRDWCSGFMIKLDFVETFLAHSHREGVCPRQLSKVTVKSITFM